MTLQSMLASRLTDLPMRRFGHTKALCSSV
jgi:hypothetical protein